MFDASLFGREARGFHFTNVLLHAGNSVLLFLLLRMLTGAVWRSVVVAALFALHPLRAESVVWVAERKDVLCGFFGLLALICYARYAQGRFQNAECSVQSREGGDAVHVSRFTSHDAVFYLLSLLFFACGLMSKAMLVTWPFVMLLLDYWPLNRLKKVECRRQKAERSVERAEPPERQKRVHARHAPRSTLLHLVWEKLPFFVLSGMLCMKRLEW
jgi:hypothetical protein